MNQQEFIDDFIAKARADNTESIIMSKYNAEGIADEIERLRAFAQFIVDGYPRGNLNHEDFRVQAYMAACDVLGISPPVLDILDKSVSNSDAETI